MVNYLGLAMVLGARYGGKIEKPRKVFLGFFIELIKYTTMRFAFFGL